VRDKVKRFVMCMALALASVGLVLAQAKAQTTPPDLTVCEDVTCENLPSELCSDGGFKITLTDFQVANTSNSGSATYEYEICQPAAGTCSNDSTKSCSDNSTCWTFKCRNGGPQVGTCNGGPNDGGSCTLNGDKDCNPSVTCQAQNPANTCFVDKFHGLSHFDVMFPQLGGTESCLPAGKCEGGTKAGNSCTNDSQCPDRKCSTSVTGFCSVGNFVLGDGSCFDGGTSQSFVAKCDNTSLAPGECLTMTVTLAGELNGIGKGAAVVVDKESTTCTTSCIAGPSCEPCNGWPGDGGKECLTRTRGFWGTHPHIADDYLPVIVCGKEIESTAAGECSTSEALCTSANDYKKNPDYLTLVAQLTAAKLNLAATAALVEGATCSGFEFDGKSIQEIIAVCEATNVCNPNATKKTISDSGCIVALDTFNNSQDTGVDVTPAPVRPSWACAA
jgi:hypothetical protein